MECGREEIDLISPLFLPLRMITWNSYILSREVYRTLEHLVYILVCYLFDKCLSNAQYVQDDWGNLLSKTEP